MKTNRKVQLLTVIVFALFFGALATQAAFCFWDGDESIYWSDPDNWVDGEIPVDGDVVRFSGGAQLYKTNYNDLVGLELSAIHMYGGDWMVEGNGISISHSILSVVGSGDSHVIDVDMQLTGSIFLYSIGGLYLEDTVISGNVDLGGHSLVVSNTTFNISGAISGTGSVIKNSGFGSLTLSGTSGNTFFGDVIVEGGIVYLAKSSGNSVPYSLIIGSGDAGAPASTVQHLSGGEINLDVTVNKSGTYDLNGFGETIRDLNLNGGADFNSGSVELGLRGHVTVDGGISSIGGELGLSSGDHDFNILYSGLIAWPNAHCTLSADVSGGGNLIKTGPGIMRIMGDNTYAGLTKVEQGAVFADSATAFGSFASGTTFYSGTRLYLSTFMPSLPMHIVGELLQMAGDISSYGYSDSWSGAITLAGDVGVNVSSGGQLELSGAVGGSGGFTKTGDGTLTLSGSSANTYTGDTLVEDGVLDLDKSTGIEAISAGSLTIGDGDGGADADVVIENSSHQIGNLPVYIAHSGLLDLNGYVDYLTGLTLDGGRVRTDAGYLGMSGDVTVLSNETNRSQIHGRIWLSALRRFDVAGTIVFDPDFVIFAEVEGTGGIEKTGVGVMALAGMNTYTGETEVNDGVLGVYSSSALGTTAGGTVVADGASLMLIGDSHVGVEMLELNGEGFGSYGALHGNIVSNSWAGAITLASDARIRVPNATDILNLGGAIGGPGGLMKDGLGTLMFSGSAANTYTGNTSVDEGTLALGKTASNSSIVAGRLTIGDGVGGSEADVVRLLNLSQIGNIRIMVTKSGLFDMNGIAEYFGSLAGDGNVDTGGGILTCGADHTTTTFSGQIKGAGKLRKYGTGTFTLSGNNTHMGGTEIAAGTLLVNGSLASRVDVGAAAILGGDGTVGKMASSGAVAPGSSPGKLSAGSTTLAPGSAFIIELDGFALADCDRLTVTGFVDLDNPDLTVQWGFVPAVGDLFTIIANDGMDAVNGMFAGLPEGGIVSAGNVDLQISYAGGDGNDVVLSAYKVTPLEPLRITSMTADSIKAVMEWEGGVPFYRIEKKESLTNGTWTAVTGPTRDFGGSVPTDTTNGFYRVTGGH